MRKIFIKSFVQTVFTTVMLVGITVMLVAPVSCKMTDDGSEGAQKDSTAPSLEELSVKDSKTFVIVCSEKIVLDNVTVTEVAPEMIQKESSAEANKNTSATKTSAKNQSQTVTAVVAKTEANTESKTDTKNGNKAETKTETKSKAETTTQNKTDTKSETVSKTGKEAEVKNQEVSKKEENKQQTETITSNKEESSKTKGEENAGEKSVETKKETTETARQENNSQETFAVADVISYSEDGKTAEVQISNDMSSGKAYIISGTVYDTTGNSLEFSQEVIRNENPAYLIFNEVRNKSDAKTQKVEFIEFFVLKEGNTLGLEVISADMGEDKKYVFPSMEVKAGQYITLHLKTLLVTSSKNKETGESQKTETPVLQWENETGDNLKLSRASESCDTARDLWIEGSEKFMSNTDILLIRDSLSGKTCDLLVLAGQGTKWEAALTKLAEKVETQGLWSFPDNQINAVLTSGSSITVTRSVSRQNTRELQNLYLTPESLDSYVPGTASDWIETNKSGNGKNAASGATPGYENSSILYVKKESNRKKTS